MENSHFEHRGIFNVLNGFPLEDKQPIVHRKNSLENDSNSEHGFTLYYIDRVSNFNQIILEKDLLPELKANEVQKRELKPKVLNSVLLLIKVHSAFLIFFLLMFVLSITTYPLFNIELNIELMKEFMSFLKFFITAIIVELIGMLAFIVKYIFDKSIVDLIMEFGKTKNNEVESIYKNNASSPKVNIENLGDNAVCGEKYPYLSEQDEFDNNICGINHEA